MTRTLALLLASAAFAYAAMASAGPYDDSGACCGPADECSDISDADYGRAASCYPGDAEFELCDAADLWSPEERALIEAGGAP